MGRLIDADAITDFMLEHNTPDSLFASVEEIVAYQPTAFDVKAVVKELERRVNNYSYQDFNDYEEGEHHAFKEAIEIVRKGGVK